MSDLESVLTKDLKWRVNEMFLWERTALSVREHERRALLRGGFAVIYSHWEGYVKTAVAAYFEYLSYKGLRIGDFRAEIAAVALSVEMQSIATAKSPEKRTNLIEMLRDESRQVAKLPRSRSDVKAESNLRFDLFASLMHSIGCDASLHQCHSALIDERLLKNRNGIAHGDELFIELDDWLETRNVVEGMLRDVRTQVSNAAAARSYLR